ncbi:DUF2871 domain-containing protein [Corynebacterium freiburgense]|uniref:DUF2871 domain-containing protein n=1 Tax=Corynebacterium freiburgense TaxID=556548 RepID=UPI00040636A0|nr:DUF2871 domain-containing protein [Corynebacterium freiburgense]WJZ03911.1 hypothetical protein CFREI_13300 [Corynebacterium freiburgense]
MQKLFSAAATYAVLGLVSGVFYREFGRFNEYFGPTRLSTLHTHLLVLGMFFFLIAIALNATLKLSENSRFNAFFWTYNIGVLWTAGMMTFKGINQVWDPNFVMSPALAGISGLGHIILTVGIVLYFMILNKQIKRVSKTA